MKFTKMHGIGNDYIYVNGFEEKIENPAEFAITWSDRHKGIGSDGLVLILPSDYCDFRMQCLTPMDRKPKCVAMLPVASGNMSTKKD